MKALRSLILSIGLSFLLPVVAMAENPNGFVPCGNPGQAPCTAQDIVTLVNTIINFLVFQVAIAIAVVIVAWAGVLYIFYPYKPGNVEQAKKMFQSAIIGFGIVLGAYLIVKFIIVGLVGPNPSNDNASLVSDLMKIFENNPAAN